VISYRLKRRAFLASVGGALGLETMLRNLEADAQGMSPPPRLLVVGWPAGTIRSHFVPSGSGTTYTTSRILQPFETAGLREDLIVLYGLSYSGLSAGGGGADEFGTVASVTGASSAGTRRNGGETDDSCAGGPSWDQILRKNVAALQRPGRGYINAIGDMRVDSFETSTRCLSYGYDTQSVLANTGGSITEHVPLSPTMSPLTLFTELFSGFIPGGGTSEEVERALRMKKSVLDSSLRDLARMRTLVPGDSRPKIDAHADAVRRLELQIQETIDQPESTCAVPEAPDASITGKSGERSSYANPVPTRDDPMLEQVSKAHLAIIRAAFECDIIRVATFHFCPGTNHVSFGGLNPADPEGNYQHHPMSHQLLDPAAYQGTPPATGPRAPLFEFLTNVHTWFNQKLADALVEFKSATDVFGGNLLDHTIVPMVTNLSNPAHTLRPLPALILGGRALGMQGGQFLNFEGNPRPHNNLWLSVARAFLPDESDIMDVLGGEIFAQNSASYDGPIPELWVKPQADME
jgi:hypothetical protein